LGYDCVDDREGRLLRNGSRTVDKQKEGLILLPFFLWLFPDVFALCTRTARGRPSETSTSCSSIESRVGDFLETKTTCLVQW
jgi:hypothetical protein